MSCGLLVSRFRRSIFWRLMPAGMRKRWWLFRPLDLIARYWPVLKQPRGVLVVRMDGIGDMVLFRRSLDHYSEIFNVASSEIIIIGCESWGALAEEVFRDYRVISINEHAFARRPFYRLRISIMVRSLAPNVTVCDSYMRRALMADSLAWVSAAPRTIVSLPYISERTRPEFSYYLSQVDEIIDTGPYPTHEVNRHFCFISTLAGRKIEPEVPYISWRKDYKVPNDWKECGDRYAVLNIGSNEPGRRWPLSSYAKIARNLTKGGFQVVVVGCLDDQYNQQLIASFFHGLDVVNLVGKTSLSELLDLFANAKLVVSSDTGPAHLSIALERPTVVIIGGGHFGSFVPYPSEVTPKDVRFVYKKMDCYHCFWRCHKRESNLQSFPCIENIEKEQVWLACKELLGLAKDNQPGTL